MPNDTNSDDLNGSSNIVEKPVLTRDSLQLWSDTNRDKFKHWFDVPNNYRSRNELFTGYAYQIVEQNFAANGLELKRGFHEKKLDWSSFCWYFYRHVCNYIKKDEYKSMMQKIFAELAEFCMFVNGSVSGRYAVLLHDFLVNFKLPEQIITLLPENILAKMPELEVSFNYWMEAEIEREQEMIRQGMMGY